MLSSKRENSLKILFGSALNLKIDIGNNIFPMQEIKLHLLKSLCSTKELKFFLPVGPIHFLGLFLSILYFVAIINYIFLSFKRKLSIFMF